MYFYQPHFFHLPLNQQVAFRPVPVSPPLSRSFIQNTPNQQTQNNQGYPPVNPNLLHQSANESNKLMKEASIVLDRLASSKEFGAELMNYAQQSKSADVKRLIQSLGVNSDVQVSFNPDGLRLEFISQADGVECCRLLVALRWR